MLPETEKKLFVLAYTQSEENSESYFYYLGCLIMNGQGYTITDLIMESMEDIRIKSIFNTKAYITAIIYPFDYKFYEGNTANDIINVMEEEESDQILELHIKTKNSKDRRGLSAKISKFKNLKKLMLRGNELYRIPASIGKLINLELLDLRHNNLIKLPESIGNLINLKNLMLDGNKISELPASIGKLTNLRIVWNNF